MTIHSLGRKNLILTGIIAVVVLLAIYILYRGFFAGQSSTSLLPVREVAPVVPILSKGTSLDVNSVEKYNPQQQLFNYAKVSPEEIGLSLSELVK